MRPLTIVLLVIAIAACFVASLAHDEFLILGARLVYSVAFVASIIAFARGLPRVPEDAWRGTAAPPGAKVRLEHG
jgi:uncharacterized membrane protein